MGLLTGMLALQPQDVQKEAATEGRGNSVDDWIALLEDEIPAQARAEDETVRKKQTGR